MFERITPFIKVTLWLLHTKAQILSLVSREANSAQILCAIWGHMINESMLGFINLPEFLTPFSCHTQNLLCWKPPLFSEYLTHT